MELDKDTIKIYEKTMFKLKELERDEEQYRNEQEILREMQEKKYEIEQIYALEQQEQLEQLKATRNQQERLTRELKRLRMKIPKKLTGMRKAIRDRNIMLENRADNIRRAEEYNKKMKTERKLIEKAKYERYLQSLKEMEIASENKIVD